MACLSEVCSLQYLFRTIQKIKQKRTGKRIISREKRREEQLIIFFFKKKKGGRDINGMKMRTGRVVYVRLRKNRRQDDLQTKSEGRISHINT